ncbi:MAG: nucleotidyltransferase domain-containing protein [Deltaproteobacteria bacterium]|nr:nucleotidyltransferase domain-containing protein [Deltaproteobacteria bacterium]
MPRTARDLTPEELGSYRPWLRIAERSKDPARVERRARAWDAARAGAALLKERYGARRVAAFGSLLSAEAFTPWSDVDLAVSGLDAGLYYEAAGAALDLGASLGVKIDVIDLDSCPSELRRAIETRGMDL